MVVWGHNGPPDEEYDKEHRIFSENMRFVQKKRVKRFRSIEYLNRISE